MHDSCSDANTQYTMHLWGRTLQPTTRLTTMTHSTVNARTPEELTLKLLGCAHDQYCPTQRRSRNSVHLSNHKTHGSYEMARNSYPSFIVCLEAKLAFDLYVLCRYTMWRDGEIVATVQARSREAVLSPLHLSPYRLDHSIVLCQAVDQ
jgi:hypothetical protein